MQDSLIPAPNRVLSIGVWVVNVSDERCRNLPSRGVWRANRSDPTGFETVVLPDQGYAILSTSVGRSILADLELPDEDRSQLGPFRRRARRHSESLREYLRSPCASITRRNGCSSDDYTIVVPDAAAAPPTWESATSSVSRTPTVRVLFVRYSLTRPSLTDIAANHRWGGLLNLSTSPRYVTTLSSLRRSSSSNGLQ